MKSSPPLTSTSSVQVAVKNAKPCVRANHRYWPFDRLRDHTPSACRRAAAFFPPSPPEPPPAPPGLTPSPGESVARFWRGRSIRGRGLVRAAALWKKGFRGQGTGFRGGRDLWQKTAGSVTAKKTPRHTCLSVGAFFFQ